MEGWIYYLHLPALTYSGTPLRYRDDKSLESIFGSPLVKPVLAPLSFPGIYKGLFSVPRSQGLNSASWTSLSIIVRAGKLEFTTPWFFSLCLMACD
jgi:hypothetical protein